MQALLLAAGMGKRLEKYTQDNTKCMVEVAGERLIDRAVEAVRAAGMTRFIVVVGYRGENLVKYLKEKYAGSEMEFVFINNVDYATSNNIYSFYLAKEHLFQEDTILLESDLIYDPALLKTLVEEPHKNVVTVAKYKSWMDGTVVRLDEQGWVMAFIEKKDMDPAELDEYYKTVNIYKFSKEFCKEVYLPTLENYMKEYGLGSYYETPLKLVTERDKRALFSYEIGDLKWYEIDNEGDLAVAEKLFG